MATEVSAAFGERATIEIGVMSADGLELLFMATPMLVKPNDRPIVT